MMKKLITMMVFLLLGIAVFAQTHTVERGENLQSIAAKYNVTVTQLLEANPGADKLFYVGLKLNIPEVVAPQTIVVESSQTMERQSAAENNVISNIKVDDDAEDNPGFEIAFMLEYGFLPKAEGVSGTNWTYAGTIGANYYFMHKQKGVFAGARIGYNSANYNKMESDGRGSYSTRKSTAHFISIPINVGYALSTRNGGLAVIPYAGLDFNLCVGGKDKYKEHSGGMSLEVESKFKKKVGIDARVGIEFRIACFNIGGAYVMPLNKGQKGYFGEDSYFAISLGYGF